MRFLKLILLLFIFIFPKDIKADSYVPVARNIAVNTQVITDPKIKEAVGIYNAAMGIIGVKNVAVGGYKFVSNLPQATKTLLENKGLRNLLLSQYLDYRIAITKFQNSDEYANLTNEVRQQIIAEKKVFSELADAKNAAKWGAADEIFINGKTKDDILNIEKGKRPLPETYLSTSYIQQHLAKFDDEVSCLSFENSFNDYGQIGRDDGLFVMPKVEMDNLLSRTGGNISKIEDELGIPKGVWSSRLNNPLKTDKLIRVDIKITHNSKLRVPSGNEIGADEILWLPGGKTFGGVLESVIEPVKKADVNNYKIKIIIQ